MKPTDEMVEVACDAFFADWARHNFQEEARTHMRGVLQRVLALRAKYTREQINEMIGRGEMFVDTNPEADWIAASEMACPHCGGSGHKDDVRP